MNIVFAEWDDNEKSSLQFYGNQLIKNWTYISMNGFCKQYWKIH